MKNISLNIDKALGTVSKGTGLRSRGQGNGMYCHIT